MSMGKAARSGFWRCSAAIAAIAFASALPHAAQAQAGTRIEIASQPMAQALMQLSRQANVDIVAPARITDGLTAPAVRGEANVERALDRLLTNSGLRYRRTSSGYVIERLRTSAANRGASTGQAASSLGEASSGSGEAVAGGAAADSRSAEQDIVVTGSRLRRSGGDAGPAPVITIGRRQIERIGGSSVADVIRYTPQLTFSDIEQTNVGGAREIRLRGLGYGNTLVLINGRRTVTSALSAGANYFDLNTIPLSAVERVEILADSASAIYGADAVGGVINVILRRSAERPVLDLRYGGAEDGATERRASLTLGHESGSVRLLGVVDYFRRSYLLGEDRDFFADQDFRRFGGLDRRSPNSNPANITSLTTANLPGQPSRIAAVPTGSTGVGLTPASFLATAGVTNLESLGAFQSVVPETRRWGAVGTIEIDIVPEVTAFGELMFSDRRDARLLPPSTINTTVPATNPFNPFGVAVNVRYLFEGLGAREEHSRSEFWRWVGGARGDIGRWDWELSVLRTEEDASNWIENQVDNARVATALAASSPAQALNVFQDGPGGTQALLESLLSVPLIDTYSSTSLQAAGFVRGPLARLPAGTIDMVVGVEARRETIDVASRRFNQFAVGEREGKSVYAEARIPIIGDGAAFPLADSVALTVAGRLDDYDDFGSTFNPQAGLEWRVSPALLLRGSFGTSFRPPSLFELNGPRTPATLPVFDPRRDETIPVTQIFGGNAALDAERARSFTAGAVVTPRWAPNLRLSAQYWSIHQTDRIVRLTGPIVLANESLFVDKIIRAAPTPADIAAGLPGRLVSIDVSSANFAELDTDGIDFSLSGSTGSAIGTLSLDLQATWIHKYRTIDILNAPPVNRVGVGNAQGSIPAWRATGVLGWQSGGLSASLSGRYTSGYDDVTTTNVRNGRRLLARVLWDAQLGADLGEILPGLDAARRLRLRAGVINLLDAGPRYSESSSAGFDISQTDTRGRFFYVELSKAF